MAIVINGSGTVTGLAVGGLPDGTVDAGTLATDSVSAVKIAANSVDSAELIDGAVDGSHLASGVGGKVLQVVYANHNTTLSTTSTSLQTTGVAAAITPSSTSNKVLITVSIPLRLNGDLAIDVDLFKGSSSIFLVGNDAGDNGTSAHENLGQYAFTYLDSPSTTSATTYTVYVRSTGGSANLVAMGNNQYGTITLQEIAG